MNFLIYTLKTIHTIIIDSENSGKNAGIYNYAGTPGILMYTSSLKIECAAKGGEGLEKGRECENYLLSKKKNITKSRV